MRALPGVAGAAVAGLALCWPLVLASCRPAAPEESPAPASGGRAVARVAGRPITTEDVAADARRRGGDARAARDRLVDEAVLAEVARRRGLRTPPAAHLRDQALAQLVLRSVERDVDENAVTSAQVDAARGEARASLVVFERRELREVDIAVPADTSMAAFERRRAAAQEIQSALAQGTPDEAAFGRAVEAVRARYPDVPIEARARLTVERRPGPSNPELDAIFRLPLGLAPEVQRSSRGLHVVIVLDVIHGREPTDEEVEAEARRLGLIAARRHATDALLASLARRIPVRIQETLVARALSDARFFAVPP